MSSLTCGFVGLGLIGGSIARALKQSVPNVTIVAYDTNREALASARADAVADTAAEALDESFSGCDYLFLCAPVKKNDGLLPAVKEIVPSHCLITDVGSVKTSIHETVHAAGLDGRFIGGHPMAGSERTGYVNSKASLLENAYYILTPSPSVAPERVEAYRALVSGMGAIPLVLDYQKHDYITAAISHLPHVIAASLVNLVRESDSREGLMKMIAAGGFKDITRIASSSPVMWQEICLSNQANISTLLADYIRALETFREKIDTRDGAALYETFDNARTYRDSFINASSGPIKRSYCIYVDIADKTGTLAQVTALLAQHQINIKNLGITHNRESEDGVLKLEFYGESAMTTAAQVLEAARFPVKVRT